MPSNWDDISSVRELSAWEAVSSLIEPGEFIFYPDNLASALLEASEVTDIKNKPIVRNSKCWKRKL